MRLEDQHHFEVRAEARAATGFADLIIACLRCPWEWNSADADEWPTLADLDDRGTEHLDAAHGGGS